MSGKAPSRVVAMLGAFLCGLVLVFGAILVMTGRTPSPIGPAVAAVGGPFQLEDQNAKPVSDKDMKGRPFLVFFGFTHCPDVCPTTLFDISQVLKSLGQDADRTGALFITVDPERDTPAALKDYLSNFDPHLRGLTGDPAAVAGGAQSLPGLCQESSPARRRLYDGPHRRGLLDGQGWPLRRAIQP